MSEQFDEVKITGSTAIALNLQRGLRVFEIMNPDGSKSMRARSPKLLRIALRRPAARRLPSRVVDPRHRSPGSREHKLRVLAPAAFNHGLRDPVQDHIAVEAVLHVRPRNHEDLI
jgi:hypothetical protein